MCCVHNVRMSDERTLTLRQADEARADFYEIRSELEVMQAQLARLPTRKQLGQAALGISFCSAAIVVLWIEIFWRHCL
jgi:hypothetical protein